MSRSLVCGHSSKLQKAQQSLEQAEHKCPMDSQHSAPWGSSQDEILPGSQNAVSGIKATTPNKHKDISFGHHKWTPLVICVCVLFALTFVVS